MKKQLDALVKGEYFDPHRILGGHPYQEGNKKGVIIGKRKTFTVFPQP